MRILHLTSRMEIGGAETHIHTLATEQIKLGHKVFCASSGGAMVSGLERGGVCHITLPLDRRDPLSIYECAKQILDTVKKEHISIVHAHSRIPAFAAGLIKEPLERAGCIFITTAHMPFCVTAPLRHLTAWSKTTIAVSRDIKEYLMREYGLREEQITVIENGIDTEKFAPDKAKREEIRSRLGIGHDSFVICSASRSSESRAAAALYLAKHSNELLGEGEVILLLLSGAVDLETDRSAEIRKAAELSNKALGRAAVIIVEGECDISPYLAAADVFVGVSRAALEAMSCACPCIIAGGEGYGGILCADNAELLREGNFTGRACTGSLGELAKDIEKLRQCDIYASGELLRKYVCESFSSELMAKRTEEVYGRATSEKRKKHLLIVGHYGADNYGDDAVCRILCSELCDKYTLHFVCRSKARFEREYPAFGVQREDIPAIMREAKRAECVIFGGGNLIQDDTSVRSLKYYESVFDISDRYAPKSAIFANGIGPLRSEASKRTAAVMLSSADYVSLREDHSHKEAASHTERADMKVSADPAYLLYSEKDEIIKKARLKGKLAEYIDGGKYAVLFPRRNMSRAQIRSVVLACRAACDKNIKTVIIPLYPEQDRNICLLMHREIPSSCVYLGGLEHRGLLKLLSSAEFAIGGRLHAGIMSIIAECPFAGFDIDRRIKANLSYAGCGGYLGAHFDPSDIETVIEKQTALARSGVYGNCAERMQRLAREDIESLKRFLVKQ